MRRRFTKIIIVSLMTFLICISIGKVYAAETLEVTDKVYSESYKEWLELPEEERENTMMPPMFNIPYKKEEETTEKNYWTNQYNNLVRALSDNLDYYCLRDDIDITVKDQGYTGECWAFSITSILETTVSKLTGQASEIFSPRHIDYSTISTFTDKTVDNNFVRDLGLGGNFYIGSGYLASGSGPVLEEDMPAVVDRKEEKINSSEIEGKEVQLRVKDIEWFPSINKEYSNGTITYNDGINSLSTSEVEEIRSDIKEHILTKGAVFAGIPGTMAGNYNPETYAYYSTDDPLGHAITIVGWDDNFSKENFLESNRPAHDGAWIVLNSYGTENNGVYEGVTAAYGKGYDGYFYVSYDDAIIETSIGGISEVSEVDYDNIYQYDDLGFTGGTPGDNGTIVAAVFDKPSKKEYLNEVGLFIYEEQYVSVMYSSGNTTKTIADRQRLHSGFNTIELTTPIELTEEYYIYVKYESIDGSEEIIIPAEFNDYKSGDVNTNSIISNADISNKTCIFLEGKFVFYRNVDFCIKAFTTNEQKQTIEPESVTLNKKGKITMNINSQEQLIATILPENANSKTNITWKSSNSNVVEVNKTGKITAKSVGEATITATTENGKEQDLEIKVINEDEIALDINPEDDVAYIVGNEKLFSVQLINIPDTEKENVEITVSDTSIAEITQVDRTNSEEGKINFKVRFKKSGKVDIFANINYNGNGFEYKFSIEIKDKETTKTVTSIKVKTLPSKTKYNLGEDLKLDGGIIEVTYSDNTKGEISMSDSNVTITGYDKNKEGNQTITVNYYNKITTFMVQVVDDSKPQDKTITSIKVKTLPSKTTYELGEDLNLEGGIIEVTYSDDTKEEVQMTDSKVIITGYDKNKTGVQTLTVNYNNKLTTFSVTVKEKDADNDNDNDNEDEVKVEKISIKSLPNKTKYKVGEELELEGGVIEVTYSDGSTKEVSLTDSKVKVTGYDNEKIGMQQVTVSYENKITTFTVQIEEEKEDEEGNEEPSNVRSISIKKLPNKTTYKTGDELELDGGILEVTYTDGSKEEIEMTDSGVTVEGYDTFKAGVQQLTIRYGGQETTLTVKLEESDEIKGSKLEEEAKGQEEKEEKKAVDTGDNIETYIIYLIGSFIVIVATGRIIKHI